MLMAVINEDDYVKQMRVSSVKLIVSVIRWIGKALGFDGINGSG